MTRLAAKTVALLLMVWAVAARAEPAGEAEDPEGLRSVWSLTAIGQYTNTASPEDDNDVGGWFDQYEFTPNKGSGFPFQLGIREASFDLFRGETAIFRSRLRSPTSNLGISGSQADDPFFNQRLDTQTRLKQIELDVSYRRIRTEQLRIFPNTESPYALLFDDLSDSDDRFYRDRTGFAAEARIRPYETFDLQGVSGSAMRPQLALRGGYEKREGNRQLRIHRPPSNNWLGLSDDQDRTVADVGAGLLISPEGRLTVAFDFDYEQLRLDDPVLTDGDLGFPPPEASRTIGFTPETDRYTGTIRFNSRLGDRLVAEGGFLISELEQVSKYTPDQRANGLRDNTVRSYGANAAGELRLADNVSVHGAFKYDRRENDIERDTPLFDDITQIDPFVEHWERFEAGAELELNFGRNGRAGLGLKYEDISRDLDFASSAGLRIQPENSLIDHDTRIVTLYGRGGGRPWRGLRLDSELGYRWAPKTGYATDLDDNVYGELRASYAFAIERPAFLSGYVRGGTGENSDFNMISGLGPAPNGTRLPRRYERTHFITGATASLSPTDRMSLSASFFYARNEQDSTLDLSNLQRYFQDVAPISFTRDGKSRVEDQHISVVLGVHAQLTQRTEASVSYSFTRAEEDYSGSTSTPALDLVDDNHHIDSDTHVVDFELGHTIVEGLDVLCGYRYQDYSDDGSVPASSVASAVAPSRRSTHQHTVTIGVTLTSAYFER